MKINISYLLVLAFLISSCTKEKPRILVFSHTKEYRHGSISAGKLVIQKLGIENGFEVDTTEFSGVFIEDSLKKYRAVVFLNTTGDVLNQFQQNEFMRFIQAGGGYVGIHAAADTEYDWWWYGKLVGAYFKNHPDIQEAKFQKVSHNDMSIDMPADWVRTDELYNYKNISKDINVLYEVDESSYKGGENGEAHPFVWYHDYDGGRSFYTGMGHTSESYAEPLFLSQLAKGINYAIGKNNLDFSKAKAKHVPEENRFTKVVLGYHFYEPTEMDILPDGRIIFLERHGGVKMYEPATDSIRLINTFQVFSTLEDGMLGLAHDPDFEKNHWLYIFYSHPAKSANVLSRFVFDGGMIDMSSEIEMLEVATQRERCCHTGGSIAFGPDKNLYVSTGDNTSPFESDGFSPADEGEGRSSFDAQKSSGNTNDLRGKIIRIHPESNGTYTIPEGNLFAKNEPKTRPEIYVMGNRNPYRISIDQKTGFLYWGEVGPDAGNDGPERGPRGYDEINQARKPGNFGWPYFVGGNYAYADYDFVKKVIGPKHNPEKPINDSPNNTGKVELPPVSPPFIWYPYDVSPDFPLMKTGGRNAMAGPVYHSQNYKDKQEAFPDYFDDKLIAYDWMRNWVRLITMDDKGDIVDIEPFMNDTKFSNIIDMAFGPDGKLYMLEYGISWNTENMDARLSRIDFNKGNRPPVAQLTADKITGAVPLTINFLSKDTSDPDGDKVTYELLHNGEIVKSIDGVFNITYNHPGIYRPKLTVTDTKGLQSSSEITIVAGNEPAVVDIKLFGNPVYYLSGGSVNYKVMVNDKEDGSTVDGKINSNRVTVTVDYLQQGYDVTDIARGHQRAELPGKLLIAESDCKSCHFIDKKSAGPAFIDVAKKYKTKTGAIELLSDKILKGGTGVWGEIAMAAHPQLSKDHTIQMVEYILTLADAKKEKALPLEGTIKFKGAPVKGELSQSAYVLTASYEDNGAAGSIPSLGAIKTIALRSPVLSVTDLTDLKGGPRLINTSGYVALDDVEHNSSAIYRQVDLTAVRKLQFIIEEVASQSTGGEIEVYLDSLTGKKMGVVNYRNTPLTSVMAGINSRSAAITIDSVTGKHNIVLVFVNAKVEATKNLFYYSSMTLGK